MIINTAIPSTMVHTAAQLAYLSKEPHHPVLFHSFHHIPFISYPSVWYGYYILGLFVFCLEFVFKL